MGSNEASNVSKFYNIINGEKRSAATFHQVTDPRTERPLWNVPIATPEDLNEAVQAANKAFQTWKKTTIPERQAALARMVEVIEANAAELADLARRETGKSVLLGQIEIGNTTRQIKVICKFLPTRPLEDHVQHEDEQVKIIATHPPLGVVAAICPWNFPVILSTLKIASALITGNCVIVKPSPFTPYAVLRIVELCQTVLPPGVFQGLHGDADLGALMTTHADIAKISFTGTIAVGKKIMAACAGTLKKLTLELAGNDAAIVLPDVDVAEAAAKTATGSFFNAGQMCVATKRVYVHEDIYDDFLQKFKAEVKEKYRIVGDGEAPSLFGPVSNKTQLKTVKGMLADAEKRGLKTESFEETVPEKGYWVPATVIIDPPEDALCVQEEQFGPIIPILRWRDEEDVLARANLDNAGLAAAVYSKDIARAESFARRLECGSVYINTFELPNENAFFSGVKDSGLGGEMGKQGLLSYCYTQSIHFSKI
ncbi:aldehyde dehydrogenase [Cryphonectria parasitica EP155]|uniref:aldehyde dehydrogenase (NAD(+)) n=1 Tax=Cryphonectria parasitica (strain ATCC 38755 / EP155) TaxID=660469 RepID=A0A9P5CNU7_CRYP1|nr:aldehyde dehydrogenase [Cryphonectria parasitica EP155]KAF3765498.1 aldehyde dehydrogenase [Cryphonectria parasitica EP155]